MGNPILILQAPYVIEDCRPPHGWPDKGEVQLRNYCTRYRNDLELVLNDINCTIKPGERVSKLDCNIFFQILRKMSIIHISF